MTREEATDLIKNCGFNVDSTLHDELERVVLEALQERPKGRWIKHPHKIWTYECSCCERLISMVLSHEKVNELYPFCHCGADMRESEQHE